MEVSGETDAPEGSLLEGQPAHSQKRGMGGPRRISSDTKTVALVGWRARSRITILTELPQLHRDITRVVLKVMSNNFL